jgi:phosphoribosylglycinamide formyltransferase-1
VTLALGVLASGRGSNLQALLEACARPGFPARVAVVISDRERAPALEHARGAGVEALWVNPKDFGDREAFDLALVHELRSRGVGLVCHAGFMRILSPAYVRAFADHGAKVSGATVHFIDEGVDTGPIVLQAAVPVEPSDTEETLSARILVEEHRLYPEAVRLFAEGRLHIQGRRVMVLPEASRG